MVAVHDVTRTPYADVMGWPFADVVAAHLMIDAIEADRRDAKAEQDREADRNRRRRRG